MDEYKLETRHIIIGVVIIFVGWLLWTQYKKEKFSPVPGWEPRQYSKYDPYYVYGMEYTEPAKLSTHNPLWGTIDQTHTAVPMATKIDPSDYQHPVNLVEPPKDMPVGKPPMHEADMVEQTMPMYERTGVMGYVDKAMDWTKRISTTQICVSIGLIALVVIVWYVVKQRKAITDFPKTMSEQIRNIFRKKPTVMNTTPINTLGMKAWGF